MVTDFTKTVISDKLAQGEDELVVEGKKKAFLDMLVELSRDGSLSYEDIREEVDTFMFEGHDTTSASMGWTLWCLAHNPDCQRRIHQELDSVFGDTDRDITTDDLKQLKYLERCIKESLRVRPSVPNFARIVEEDTVIGIPARDIKYCFRRCLCPAGMFHHHLSLDASLQRRHLEGPVRIRSRQIRGRERGSAASLRLYSVQCRPEELYRFVLSQLCLTHF